MPENKMVLLIEGQRPIFGEKLRFFQTQPFKSAEAYSQANIPQVPEVDYFPPKAVPATTPQYANGGENRSKFPRRRQRKRRSLWRPPRRRQHRSRQPLQQKRVVC